MIVASCICYWIVILHTTGLQKCLKLRYHDFPPWQTSSWWTRSCTYCTCLVKQANEHWQFMVKQALSKLWFFASRFFISKHRNLAQRSSVDRFLIHYCPQQLKWNIISPQLFTIISWPQIYYNKVYWSWDKTNICRRMTSRRVYWSTRVWRLLSHVDLVKTP